MEDFCFIHYLQFLFLSSVILCLNFCTKNEFSWVQKRIFFFFGVKAFSVINKAVVAPSCGEKRSPQRCGGANWKKGSPHSQY